MTGLESALPPGHFYNGVFLHGLGRTQMAAEKYDESQATLEQAHQIMLNALGPENDRTVKVSESMEELANAR